MVIGDIVGIFSVLDGKMLKYRLTVGTGVEGGRGGRGRSQRVTLSVTGCVSIWARLLKCEAGGFLGLCHRPQIFLPSISQCDSRN